MEQTGEPMDMDNVNKIFKELARRIYVFVLRGPHLKRAQDRKRRLDEVRMQYVPVPYNMEFELGIIAKSQDTGLQILEQILPYFQPNFNVTLNFIPDMDEKKDVSIILNNINYADDWDDNFLDRRSIVWTMSFTARSYIYGPFNKSDVIKKAIVYESTGDRNQGKRQTKMTYSPKAKTDKNADGVIDAADDALVISTDDFGFNEGIELL